MVRIAVVLVLVVVSFTADLTAADDVPYSTKYFDQNLDHFNFQSHGNKTFKQKYLIADKFWHRGVGPIFLYTGNEGDIEMFWNMSGFIKTLAKEMGALLLYIEHRYYGSSLPFGSFSFTGSNLGLLSIEQALADYVLILKTIRLDQNRSCCPVIAFGGSYGGMLSAYIRLKYPDVIQGSIAASAPVYLAAGQRLGATFFSLVTKDFREASPNCEAKVRMGFRSLEQYDKDGDYGPLSSLFHLCSPISTHTHFIHMLKWIRNSFVTQAMMDYPFPSTFLADLPAYPVNVSCHYLETEPDPIQGLFKVTALLYNSTKSKTCFKPDKEFIDCADQTSCGSGTNGISWDYQACTQVDLPGGSTGVEDMFPALPWTQDDRRRYCRETYGVEPRAGYLAVYMGGRDISVVPTNILFSNGDLDPWSGGGVPPDVATSGGAPHGGASLLVKGGAHHLDLCPPHPDDPAGVRVVRDREREAIRAWVKSWKQAYC